MIENYQPIDYRKWILGDEARKGVNIKRLGWLNKKELDLVEESIPYQDQRDDPGHWEITAYFSIKLLDYLPGKREIVIPAAICHDTGWFGDDPKAWKKLIEKNEKNLQALEGEATRRPHQNRGCLISGKIFERANYPPEQYHNSIADIIGDHDTRNLPTTFEGRIVRAADFLWRVTYPLMQIYLSDKNAEESLKRTEETCLNLNPPKGLETLEKKIARIELANSILFKFGEEESIRVLGEEYSSELQKVKESYKRM